MMVKVNETDLEAQRILAIAIALINAKRPLPTSYFYDNFYPGRDDEVRRKSFQRDRYRLARCGLVVKRDVSAGAAAWAIDRTSLAQPNALTPTEALTIDVALLPFASEPSFPYAEDLRMALSKIDRSFSEVTVARLHQRACRRSRAQELVERCLSARHALRITYVKANDTQVERTVGVCGLFSLRGVSYMVAVRLETGQEATPAHTYNIDRIVKASELSRLTYDIPSDFEVRDYIKLPFQIGHESYLARFRIPKQLLHEFRSETRGRGDFEEIVRPGTGVASSSKDGITKASENSPQEPEPLPSNTDAVSGHSRPSSTIMQSEHIANTDVIWSITVCDTSAAASWAIAEGIRPIEPANLVMEWRDALEHGLATEVVPPLHASPKGSAPSVAETKRTLPYDKRSNAVSSRGRRSGLQEARRLVALLGALSEEGDSISAAAISSRLGIEMPEAKKLLELVSSAGGEDGNYLSLYAEEGQARLTLMEFAGTLRGLPLRLTEDETVALHAAFEALGTKADDPLRIKVESSYASPSISPKEVRRSLSLASSDQDESVVRLCSQALAEGYGLTFSYQGTCDAEARHREVKPLCLRRSGDSWYLDALDLALKQERTFRTDRMTDVMPREKGAEFVSEDAGTDPNPARVKTRLAAPETDHMDPLARSAADASPQREVGLRFSDPRYLALFTWPGLVPVVSKRRGITDGRDGTEEGAAFDAIILYYGNGRPWLARHVAACRGTVATDDRELAQEVRQYISSLLGE